MFMIPGGVRVMRKLGISLVKVEETDFFYEAVMSSLKHRRGTKTRSS